MNRIIFYFCFLILFGCSGYEPLFLKKNLSFYIEDIKNINNDKITRKISKNLNGSKLRTDDKNAYVLNISSNLIDKITSKDSRGNALTYELIIDVEVKVFEKNSSLSFYTFRLNDSFNYNNQDNKFDLGRYKKNILENIINKISQDIVIKLEAI